MPGKQEIGPGKALELTQRISWAKEGLAEIGDLRARVRNLTADQQKMKIEFAAMLRAVTFNEALNTVQKDYTSFSQNPSVDNMSMCERTRRTLVNVKYHLGVQEILKSSSSS